MRMFLSGEIEAPAYDDFNRISNDVENQLKFICEKNIGLEDINNYGTEFKIIGVISIVVSKELIASGRTERKLIKRKAKEADIRLYIDYERFIEETNENQRLMYIKNIIDSINVIIQKSQTDFDGSKLKHDVLEALNVTQDQIDAISNN